jgi:hypothetical protein
MAKTIRPSINGGVDTTPVINAPIIPVKTEQQLLLEVELERLQRENEALRAKPANGLTLRVSEKGALSVYGMGRFPFTLYVEQWERLLGMVDEIKGFIKANGSKLSRKA